MNEFGYFESEVQATWYEEVHRMFYTAMRAADVPDLKANLTAEYTFPENA